MKRVIIALTLLLITIKGFTMEIKSPAFENEGFIPAKYTCDGEDISIPLIFEDIPKEAKTLAIIMDDPDAPVGVFVHWVIYDIPAEINSLPEGIPNAPVLEYNIKQGVNDFGKIGYGGPCPPNGAHRYFIKVYALDKALNAEPGISKSNLLNLISGHVVDEAVLMGIYER
ncbi:YbhB/YbcL family Raf kinase inhibitor-like protein [Nitrosophilus kaiyonis]|uniref:YbhB/YbcL family Raf kinase inhibitor-like protein n=1 Tax=Nitrosophilus kaiyonis TaxID=2930200 RepID=UPI002492F7FF|nr:YbhB/YbcL family Raf kinase inhibitor-like protein [Nitrosophilus kaiyonis]